MNRGLAEVLTVLSADARLFLGSATARASCAERRNRRWRYLGGAWHRLELGLCFARDRMNGGGWLGDDLGVRYLLPQNTLYVNFARLREGVCFAYLPTS